ncbi:hypothetical protein KXX03_006328, partial [Aspergillus fumigatus]
MQGRDNIAKDGSSASTLKAMDGELIGIAPGAVSLLPSTTSSHAVTDDGYAAPVPPKIEATQERATVSRNVSPQPPVDIGHSVAVEDNTCAASNGTLVVESDQRPEDTIPCDPVDAGALIAGPKEALAKAEEENDHLIPDEIAKLLLGGANAQHSSTFSTCPNPAAAMDNLEACELQENGQQPCEVGHDSSSHSSTNARLLQPCENYPEFSKGTFAKIQLKLANAQCDKTVRYIIYIHDIVRPFRETALSPKLMVTKYSFIADHLNFGAESPIEKEKEL